MEQRKILFKAKRLDNNQWVKGSLVKSPLGTRIVWWEDSIEYAPYVDPATVCQFTGLKDKFGNPIYENDIMVQLVTNFLYTVIWHTATPCWAVESNGELPMYFNLGMVADLEFKVVSNKFNRKEEK